MNNSVKILCKLRGLFLLFAVCLLASSSIAEDVNSWKLSAGTPIERKLPIQGENYFTIVTDNPELSGEVHFTEGGGNLRFRLLRQGKLLWEKPAPSSWIMIPSGVDIVVMVGQQSGEGFIHDGATVYERLLVYDTEGNEIANVQDTGPISRLTLLSDGCVVYLSLSTISLNDLAKDGKLLWSVTADVDDLDVFEGDQFFTTGKWRSEDNTYEAALYEMGTGELIKSIREQNDIDPIFFDISSDQCFAFVRTAEKTEPRTWNVDIFEIGQWQEPVLRLESLPGGPFAADRNGGDGSIALGLIAAYTAGEPNPTQVRLIVVSREGKITFEHDFDPGQFDWDSTYLRYGPAGSSLAVFFHSTRFEFTRTNQQQEGR